jgi:EF hand domain-containing protein
MEAIMLKQSKIAWVMLVILLLAAAGARLGSAVAQDKAPDAKKLELGQSDVKQLLLLMDTDKNGKISKKEYMDFMEAEFDRLDMDKSGELDPKELLRSRLRPSRFAGR